MKIPEEVQQRLKWSGAEPDGDQLRPPVITEILYENVPCPDCDRWVSNRIVDTRLTANPVPHWKTRCKSCGFYAHPITGEFNCNYNQSQNRNLKLRHSDK